MFFDTSHPRVIPLLALAAVLAATTAWTTTLWLENRPLERAVGEAFARARSDIEYAIRFKLPHSMLAALGGARAAGSATQAPPTTPAISVPVLLYHGESGGPDMPQATFVQQMRALHEAGWRTVTLSQFEAFMRGEASVPDKSFLLTFDDGRTDTFYPADPVLKDFGYTAVMFVITGSSLPDNRDTAVNSYYLNKGELAFMQRSGRWELQSHGRDDHAGYDVPSASSNDGGTPETLSSRHFLSNKFWLAGQGRLETAEEYRTRIETDLHVARDMLAEGFGIPVTGYAYPFNDFGQESENFPDATSVIDEVVRSLYDYAFYQTWAGNGDSFNYPDRGAHLVKRIEPAASWSGATLIAVLEGGRAKKLPYYTEGPFDPEWQKNWGLVARGKTLAFTAATSTTGAAAFLDGSESWRDYATSASMDIEHGTVSLIARHTERGTPYLVCAFSGDRIYLEQHVGDTQKTLVSALYTPPPLPASYRVVMTVNGSEVACRAYGVVVRATIPGMSPRGGIGISVWHPQLGHASAALTSVSVTTP